MAGDKYRVFVSSRMGEFKNERAIIKEELNEFFSTFVYENDAGARAQSIRDTYTEELEKCDLYIGLFGTGYGEYTIDEYDYARTNNIDCLIYERELVNGEERDKDLSKFIEKISGIESEHKLTVCRFSDGSDLIRKIKNDLAAWAKSRDKTKTDTPVSFKLDFGKKYYCNRETQSVDFLMSDKNEKLNFFIIDGVRKQSHTSLVKRFSLEKTASDNVKGPIPLDDKGNIKRLKVYVQMQLFEKFGLKPNFEDMSLNKLTKSIAQENFEKVFVVFRVDEDLLTNKDIIEVVRWFSKDYCFEKKLPKESPDFYFFLLIRYNSIGASKKKSIQKSLNKLSEYVKFDELENVGPKHLREWIEYCGITVYETIQEEILNNYFPEESYPMEVAEMNIARFISDYNNKNNELMQLLKNG